MSARWVATLLFIVACSDDGPSPRTQPPADPASAAQACQQFTREGLKLNAKNQQQLIAEAGRPLDVSRQVVPNRHVPGAQDSIIRYVYDGMTVQLRKPGPGGELFEQVEVSKRKWLNFPFFRPGLSRTNLVSVLGEPQRSDGNELTYECGGGEVENPIVFEMENDAVKRVVFHYYVD